MTKRNRRQQRRGARSGHDFARLGRQHNPMKVSDEHGSRRFILKILFALASFIATIGIVLYHPFFHIDTIHVRGVDRIQPQEVERVSAGYIDNMRFFVLPRMNYFLVDMSGLKDVLHERFSLQGASISKQFPATLTIDLDERLSTVVYDDGNAYYYVGRDGIAIEGIRPVEAHEWRVTTKTVTSTNDAGEVVTEEKEVSRKHIPDTNVLTTIAGEYPLIYDRTASTTQTDTAAIDASIAESVLTWYEFLQERGENIRYMELENDFGHGRIHIANAASIKVVFGQHTQEQQERYDMARKEVAQTQVSYFDLRFPDRVYWR